MKKAILILFMFFTSSMILSCGKSGKDVYAGVDKADNLFSRMKDDIDYREFYELAQMNSNIIKSNSKKSGKADTAVLNDKSLTLEEKYKKLGYSGYSSVEANTIKQQELINRLIRKYPEFSTLSEPESKRLVTLSNKYYQKQKISKQ